MVGGPYLTFVTLSADNPLLIKVYRGVVTYAHIFSLGKSQLCFVINS